MGCVGKTVKYGTRQCAIESKEMGTHIHNPNQPIQCEAIVDSKYVHGE